MAVALAFWFELIAICLVDAPQFRENCLCARFIFGDFAPLSVSVNLVS